MMDKLQDVSDTDTDVLEVIDQRVGQTFLYYYEDESTLVEALLPARIRFEDLTAFYMAVWDSLANEMYYKALMKVLEKPLHPSSPYRVIAKENPWVLVAIAVGVEANMMSIRTRTDLFEGVDMFKFNGDREEVIIAPPLTGPSPERLQVLSDRFKPLTGEDLPKGDVNTVATFLFDKLNIPIVVQPGKPVVLKERKFFDNLAVHFVVKFHKILGAKPPSSFYDMTSHLNLDEWRTFCVTRMAEKRCTLSPLSHAHNLRWDPVSPRDVAYPEVGREICNFFTQSGEPTYPGWLNDMLSKNKDDEDAPRQPGDDLLIDFSDGQAPAPNLTAGPTISSPPNAERFCAEAGDADRPSCSPSADAQAEKSNSEPSSLDGSTACECNATEAQTEAQIEAHESLASEMSSNPASDEETFVAIREVIHSEFKGMFDTSNAALKDMVHSEFKTMLNSNAEFRETIHSEFKTMLDTSHTAFKEMVHSEFKVMLDSNAAFIEKIHSEFEAVHASIAAFGAELESFRISERQRSAGPLIMLCVLVAAVAVLVAALAVLVCLNYTQASRPVFELPRIEN